MAECYFCKQNVSEPDFKNARLLQRFITGLGKIRSKRTTGFCTFHQRKLATAIKRARNLGLLSPTTKI